MRKTGIIFIVLGGIELLASISSLKNALSTGMIMLALSVCCGFLGLILFKIGAKRRKKILENGLPYKETSWGKIILWIFISLFLFGTIGSIINKAIVQPQKENTLQGQISKANKLCPIEIIKEVASITKIMDENNQVVYYLNYNDNKLNLDLLEKNPKVAKNLLLISFGILNGQRINNGDKLVNLLLKNNYGVAFDISSDNSHFRIAIDGKELKEKIKLGKLPDKSVKEVLDMQMQLSQNSLPQKVDEGMTITDIYLDNHNIIDKLEVDENTYSISNFKTNASQIKEELYNNLAREVSSMALLYICKVAHTGIIYRIVGNTTKDSCDIIIDSEYISSHTTTPNKLNIK